MNWAFIEGKMESHGKGKGVCKIEASIVDRVHLTTHWGHVMLTWTRSIVFEQT